MLVYTLIHKCFFPFTMWVSNSGCQTWQQMPLLTDLSVFILIFVIVLCFSSSTVSLSHDSLSSLSSTLLVRLFKELLIRLIECFISSISICSFTLAFLTCWILFSYILCLLISFSCLCILSILHCNLVCIHTEPDQFSTLLDTKRF